MVKAPEFPICVLSVLSFGIFNTIAVGCDMLVVKMKKVMSRNPRSTIGVRSTRVDNFFDFGTPGLGLEVVVVISAMWGVLVLGFEVWGLGFE